ncbi:MAG: SDR family NAD(P)-dependent oxidoreductase [Treponema sp.]|nr:SDR family NAD(P)-dependent oxidoreductase [Treponema sp.]
MDKELLIAPLIRGFLVEKTGCPWVVQGCERGAGEKTIVVDTQAEDRKKALEVFRASLETCGNDSEIPLRWRILWAGEEYCFCAAEDFEGIEKIKRNEQKDCRDAACIRAAAAKRNRDDAVRNRTALVTGGAQGFGEEIVRGLCAAGALVFIADLNLKGAEALAFALNGEYGKTVAFPVEVNVSDEESVEKMVNFVAGTAGGLDLCISNAGVLRASAILEQDMASFKFVTDVNYLAFAMVSKHCGRLMSVQHESSPSWHTDIIQINSKSGLEGSNKNGSYAGSKFGGIGLVQSFALELVEYNIKVNAICPGNFFDGPLWSDPEKGLFVQYLNAGKVPGAKTVADVKAFYEAKVPMGRGCTGPDVIRAVMYLVEQIYETGQALPVTGGQVMLH